MEIATTLADELSELFQEHVSVKEVTQRQLGGATLSVTTMSYRSQSDSSSTSSMGRHYKQTVVVLDDVQLDVPEFSLLPKPKGLFGVLIKAMGNLSTVEFPESPEFTENYMLHAWVTEPVRVLFTKAVRDQLIADRRWSVRGKQHRLVIYQTDRVCKATEVDEFVRDALEILALFQEGEEELDAQPEIRREVRPEDISAAASQMSGFAGTLLQNQLKKISVTRKELDSFTGSALPREIPPGLHRQVVGDNFPLIIVGILFTIGGLTGGIVWIMLTEGLMKFMGIPMLVIFPIAGFLMAFLTLRHRKRKTRTLREGVLTKGVVTDIAKSNVTINSQIRFHVTIQYDHHGSQRTTVANAYGAAVDLARSLKESGQETKLLVDPEDPSHVVCLDILILFD